MATFSRGRSVIGNKINTTIYYKNTKAKLHILNCTKALHSSNISSYNSFNSKRTLFKLFRRPKLAEIKIKDNVSDEYSLIYRNTMERYILFAQVFTTVSAVVVAIFTVIIYDYKNLKHKVSTQSPGGETQNQRYFYLTTFILFVVILQMLVYKLPIRIYYLSQQKKYIYVFHGSYPFASRKLTCSVGDVMKLPEKGISPWKDVKYHIRNEQEVILMESCFKRPADLYIMLGIQRDPDDT